MQPNADDVIVSMNKIEHEILVNASVEKTFASLLEINGWWAQRFVPKPDALHLETRVGGRFWESRDGKDNNGILWGMVTSIEPNDHIVLSGSIGMSDAVMGAVTLCTIPQDDATTKITLVHQIIGAVSQTSVDMFRLGWQQNLKCLKIFVETGEQISFSGD